MKLIGKVVHYYDKIGVVAIDLEAGLKVGDTVTIGEGDDAFEQKVDSMQIDNENVEKAKKGDSIGLKVSQPVKGKAKVFK